MVVRGVHLDRPGVFHRKVRRAAITAAESVPVQLDGDPGGYVESAGPGGWTVEVLPQGIEVLVPAVSI